MSAVAVDDASLKPMTDAEFREHYKMRAESMCWTPETGEGFMEFIERNAYAQGMLDYMNFQHLLQTPSPEFHHYMAVNYPKDTIIHDPSWHAPRIFRAAVYAIRSILLDDPRNRDRTSDPHNDVDLIDDDGYPTEYALKRVREWEHADFNGLMEFVKELWYYKNSFRETPDSDKVSHSLATGGWSGCEDVIQALQENRMFWAMCWVSSSRGGLHEFKIRPVYASVNKPIP